MMREDKGRSEATIRSKKSEKTSFQINLCIQRLDSFARPRFLCITRSPPSEHRALLSERLEQWLSQQQ